MFLIFRQKFLSSSFFLSFHYFSYFCHVYFLNICVTQKSPKSLKNHQKSDFLSQLFHFKKVQEHSSRCLIERYERGEKIPKIIPIDLSFDEKVRKKVI